MEFCEGGSLDMLYKKVKDKGWRTGEKVLGKIAESVLAGLNYLHGCKIIHRGESNILARPSVVVCNGLPPFPRLSRIVRRSVRCC